MRLGFFTVFRKDPVHYVLAEILVRSAKAVMPDVRVMQFTDLTSPPVYGVDDVWRKPHGRMLERRMEFYAEANGDWLLLDTDIVVQHDVRHVFDQTFDVAMADREWSLVKDHYKYSREMPYNTGVVFQHTPAFYAAALAIWRAYPAEKQANWWSEQWAVADAAAAGRHQLLVLPGMTYNRPPAMFDEDVSAAALVHYKGPARKLWMIQKAMPKHGYEQAMVKAAG